MPTEVKILDIARGIADRFSPVPKIVFSGLKEGEKISEILVSEQDGLVRLVGNDGAVAIRQKALDLDQILSSQVNPDNALELMRELCA